MPTISLVKKYIIRGHIETKSGLHIGGTDSGFSIGSTDATVIKHPITGEPYIPGSSLKGKMRSLTELRDGTLGTKRYGQISAGPTEKADDLAARIFGTANNEDSQRPSRIIVRDAMLSQSSKKEKEGRFRLFGSRNKDRSIDRPNYFQSHAQIYGKGTSRSKI